MRYLVGVMCVLLCACSAQQDFPPAQPVASISKDGAPPETILFPSKSGDVTFTHQKHYERLGGDCSMCHTKLFPQSLAQLNYKKALHRAAEADRTSCAFCHAVGGTSFAADSNCIKCHAQKDYSTH
jgi:c(7)-type cytochrome triheme protein